MKVARWLRPVMAAFIAAWCCAALALDPSLDVSQYGHTSWKSLDGFGSGTIGAMAQTTDGYLWLGTNRGLRRFDGVRNVPWEPTEGNTLPDRRVHALLAARDGTLWIGTIRGLVSWKDGVFTRYPALDGKITHALAEDSDGTIWVGGVDSGKGMICSVRAATVECLGSDGRFGSTILALHRDPAGSMWAVERERLWKWKPDPAVSYALPVSVGALRTIADTPDGGIVLASDGGMVKFLDGEVRPMGPDHGLGGRFSKVLLDRDGALWMSPVNGGLLHLHDGRFDQFTVAEGLTSNQVYGMFEDREGNVWVATRDGLDRFRPIAASTFGRAQGINGQASAVVAAPDGSVWASTTSGLYRVDHRRAVQVVAKVPSGILLLDHRGRIWAGGAVDGLRYIEHGRVVTLRGPGSDYDAFAEDSAGNVWIADRDDGLLRFAPDGKTSATRWADISASGPASSVTFDPRDGGFWFGFWSGDVIHTVDGKVRARFALGEGAPDRIVNSIRIDEQGTVWVSTDTGVTRIVEGRIRGRLDTDDGLACVPVYQTLEDAHAVWMYTSCGIMRLAREQRDAWLAAVDRGEKYRVHMRVFDEWDGIRTDLLTNRSGQRAEMRHQQPRMLETADGRIWVSTNDGLAVLDPARIPFNAVPPPVRIERIVADGRPHPGKSSLSLPPLTRNLEIEYNGLCLTLPEKVEFRYRLEGRDGAWQEAGTRRSAFYTDLAPGRYRFRVIAANNSGVWNDEGDEIDFSIAPAWWQRTSVHATAAALLALLLYGLYRLRVARVSRQMGVALDARVKERLRIARDLHDTLLQSFHGLLLRFQTALQLWPAAEGKKILEKTIDQAAAAITEGRDAVYGLRESATEIDDLAEAIRTLGQTLAVEQGVAQTPTLCVDVQGAVHGLHPIVRDEIFRIAAEALRNAFRHASAHRIEVDMRYDTRQFSLRVRDDGRGMNASTLAGARERHFGLRGMRERAEVIGGKLALWSAEGTGTEVELVIPASHAYAVPVTAGASTTTGET